MSTTGGYRFYSSYSQDQHPFNLTRQSSLNSNSSKSSKFSKFSRTSSKASRAAKWEEHTATARSYYEDERPKEEGRRPVLYLMARSLTLVLFVAAMGLTATGVANNADVKSTGLVMLPILAPFIAMCLALLDLFVFRVRHRFSSIICDILIFPLLVVPSILLIFTTTIVSNMIRENRNKHSVQGDTLMACGSFVVISGAMVMVGCMIFNLVRVLGEKSKRRSGYMPAKKTRSRKVPVAPSVIRGGRRRELAGKLAKVRVCRG